VAISDCCKNACAVWNKIWSNFELFFYEKLKNVSENLPRVYRKNEDFQVFNMGEHPAHCTQVLWGCIKIDFVLEVVCLH